MTDELPSVEPLSDELRTLFSEQAMSLIEQINANLIDLVDKGASPEQAHTVYANNLLFQAANLAILNARKHQSREPREDVWMRRAKDTFEKARDELPKVTWRYRFVPPDEPPPATGEAG